MGSVSHWFKVLLEQRGGGALQALGHLGGEQSGESGLEVRSGGSSG